MFPYLELGPIAFGPVALSPAMLLVAAAIVVGHLLLVTRARTAGVDADLAPGFSAAMLVGGLLAGHWVKLLYLPDAWHTITEQPGVLLRILSGQASFGGLFGGIAAGFAYLRWNGVRGDGALRWFDLFASVFPAAWIFGRLHCYLVHDHPGLRTGHWLGVRYPDGPRWDLALLEVLFLLPLIPALPWMFRRARPGQVVGGFLVSYGVFRFLLDFLHVDAPRYLGVTVDTWASVLAIALGGLALLRR